ncbi:glycosyltransferase family 2 protein [Desulfonema magnum]|uniref:Lipopolysaccharide core biosynthesis glycosyltransferase, WaaE-like n=1 Tax=Desulfonema magnum TaxID=45655 RepID=A0A975BFI3_9BACT|nr:glycosyltransferase family 2 protein [Desulfonema magnum]QTA84348.1 Putative lipopolysaccharide core biosynthesis glycosyltransferase, WaaE-like [Desulfonema magnum]
MNTKLSVAIVAQDEEDRLPRCLESLFFADEVLVVDSGSQDDTVDIAGSFGCNVLFQPWLGYARQKQYAVDHCQNDWVLILDADERVPKETADEIKKILGEPSYVAYSFLRKSFFHDRWIRCCGWWPNRVLRLVDRRQGRFNDHLVHESWIADGDVKELDIVLEHYSFRNYADLIHKMQIYSTLAAEEMLQDGRRAGWWTPFSHGLWMFVRSYFLELGISEGFDGFMISMMNAQGSFMKYAKLRELEIRNLKLET